jgi:DNA replication protein DnaC
MMERAHIFDLMNELKLFGMGSAYDDVMAARIKRQHEPPQIVGDLLKAEIAEKQARSIKYQMTIAKLPLAKDIDDFEFDGAIVNETLVRDLLSGGFVIPVLVRLSSRSRPPSRSGGSDSFLAGEALCA